MICESETCTCANAPDHLPAISLPVKNLAFWYGLCRETVKSWSHNYQPSSDPSLYSHTVSCCCSKRARMRRFLANQRAFVMSVVSSQDFRFGQRGNTTVSSTASSHRSLSRVCGVIHAPSSNFCVMFRLVLLFILMQTAKKDEDVRVLTAEPRRGVDQAANS